MNATSVAMIQGQGFCPMCGTMAGWGWMGMILMVLFWAAVIALLVWLVYRLVGGRGRTDAARSPEDVVDERYARGDIDRETYERMKEDLGR